MSRRGNRLGHVVVALWLGVHAVALLRALPLPAPLGGRLPWRMFLVPSGVRVEIVAEGLGADGGWTPIALRRLFRFSRGATDEPLYEESEVLAARGRTGERAAFARWIGLGLTDSFRLFAQPPKSYSWWDYRQLAFPKNHGLRIDHILVSAALASRCTSCTIDRAARKGEKPSDHAPVIAQFAEAGGAATGRRA